MAIDKVFYNSNMTYLADMKGNEVTTTSLSLIEAFKFAKDNQARFYFDEVSNYELKEASKYLSNISSVQNRDIFLFFETCEDANLGRLIGEKFSSIEHTTSVIKTILSEYEVSLLNLEHYGTDTYIASHIVNILIEADYENNPYQADIKQLLSNFVLNTPIKENDKFIDFYNYDLITLTEQMYKIDDKYEEPIQKFKKAFQESYEESSEAIETFIGLLVCYGGDATHKIYKAMLEVIDDIDNEKYISSDKENFIIAIRDGDYE